ncbi:MAG: NADH-quinone oxidoreductase subunit [Actinomycetia bacterium]|nr:NADH-quinone oxidoreductase subunit [Actinomycetes bacterium]
MSSVGSMTKDGLLANVATFDEYRASGGGNGVVATTALGSEATIREVEQSGLRGRGGGGFPTGRKWRAVRDAGGSRRFVVVNGAEGEPGTFKDRAIMRANPYQVIEGVAVAALAVGASDVYFAIKASFTREIERVAQAAADMAAAGLLGDLSFTIARGPDEYLFGEEKAMLEVIEGNDPLPRVLPPYLHGLFATMPQPGWDAHASVNDIDTGTGTGTGTDGSNPTLVNNVETLAHVASILDRGASWFRSRGTPRSPGTMVFTVVGDVARPCVAELEMGTPLRVLVEDVGGGTASGRPVKMVCSGVANAVLPGDRLDVPMHFDALANAGGGLGSGGFVVYGDDVCALAVAHAYSNFLWVESCGQCPACKLGSGAITAALADLEARGDADQLAVLQRALATVTDGSRCGLPAEEQKVVGSLLRRFPEDVVAHEEGDGRHCALGHDVIVPKVVDLEDGAVTYDLRQQYKRPDWTYAEPAA